MQQERREACLSCTSNIPAYGLQRLEDAQHLRLAALYLPLNLKSIGFSVEQP
jgi:hypothetical protein